MPGTFAEWTSVVQILSLLLGALAVVTGMRTQVMLLTREIHKLSGTIEDLRTGVAHLDRRLSFLEGQSGRGRPRLATMNAHDDEGEGEKG